MNKLPQSPGDVIVVCAKGGSSAMVAGLLRQSGIPAKNLDGGMIAYGEYLEPVPVPLAKDDGSLFEMWQINRRGKGCLSYMRSLYHTLREKLGMLSPEVQVLPAHYASATEIGEDGTVSARLGDLRERLPEFHIPNEQAFVDAMIRAVKTPPSSYADIIRTNLGSLSPDAEHMTEWELGKNQCAASTRAVVSYEF